MASRGKTEVFISPGFTFTKQICLTNLLFAMNKNWEKSKKELRRNDVQDFQYEANKKKKLKPVEKNKYRLKTFELDEA